jgi:hypothetical protein
MVTLVAVVSMLLLIYFVPGTMFYFFIAVFIIVGIMAVSACVSFVFLRLLPRPCA